MKKTVLFIVSLSWTWFISPRYMDFDYTQRYVIKKPGETIDYEKIKHGKQLTSDYINPEYVDPAVILQERFKRAKEIELEGITPYRATNPGVITPTMGNTSNQ